MQALYITHFASALRSTVFVAAMIMALGILCTPVTSLAYANDANKNSAAEGFVQKLGDDAIKLLTGENIDAEKRKRNFRRLFSENFSVKYLGRFAMGRYWRTADEKQKEEYLALFEDMVVDVYSKRFEEYSGQTFKVLSSRPVGKSDVAVQSQVTPEKGPDVVVDWRLRKKNGKYLVIDIIVEGVSMGITQRSDFAAVIQRGGGEVDALITSLRKRNNGEQPKEL